ncbi:MAG: hypothetical protein A2Z31_00975 [candidate division NC10 bacterium RBG_16_65_8]|nr:MAG: hypothetical protein A2Z31_00975 [candidate division NC10 bacterium RBG_16_65_8]
MRLLLAQGAGAPFAKRFTHPAVSVARRPDATGSDRDDTSRLVSLDRAAFSQTTLVYAMQDR